MNTLFDMTLEEAKQWLRDRVDEGAHCPCCGQFAKVYKRRIHSTMARALIIMHRADKDAGWLYLPDLLQPLGRAVGGGDAAKNVYWKLIEEDGDTRDDGSTRTGWWRLTPRGRGFVLGTEKVPKYARIYDGRLLGFEGEMVSIVDALGTKFDYQVLMSS